MQIITEKDYESLGRRAAADLIATASAFEAPLICATSGSTPASLYAALVQKKEKVDFKKYFFVGLDEWAGMNAADDGSCQQFVQQTLFQPLQIPAAQVCFFDGRANLDAECARVEAFLKAHGPLRVAVIGLGLNGHVGMNEPGTPATARAHISELTTQTQNVGQKYFSKPKDLSRGVTLGIENLLQADAIFLLAAGAQKAAIVKEVIHQKETAQLPATLLKKHPHFFMYLDAEAAMLL